MTKFRKSGVSDMEEYIQKTNGDIRKLTMTTTLPCIQVYTGNFLSGGCNGKGGKPYENRDGVALEAQFLPNSIHIEKEPKVILRKGEEYEAVTTYRFEVE